MQRYPVKHIAFIPDGNRRWARGQHQHVFVGHREGFETIRNVYRWLLEYGIQYGTFYLFSTENWQRDPSEVNNIFDLYREVCRDIMKSCNKNGIRMVAIGDIDKLPPDIRDHLQEMAEKTKNNDRLTLVAAMGYGGRDEITRVARKIAQDAVAGKLDPNSITEQCFESYLDTVGLPPPDILVRTSEHRLSNFLLWQSAYSEIFFVDKLWPEFTQQDLHNILEEFLNRKRRYGE